MSDLKRILIVEDNPNDLELTMIALASYNLANEVVTARDGVEALDYLHGRGRFAGRPAGNPAIVLLDVKMPKVDGIEVLRRIRCDDRLRETPVVMLTSSREEKDILESYELGVNGYVVKPVAFQEFVAAVRNIGLFWALLNEPPPGSVKRFG